MDVYDALNSNITKWMIIIPKLTVFSLLFIIFGQDISFLKGITAPFNIDIVLLIAASLSLIIGSGALYRQFHIKRFFAYSGISHVGFLLLAFLSSDFHAYFIYLFIYGITTINIFSILLSLSIYKGREIRSIDHLKGTFNLNPFLGIAFAINLFSLAGVCQFYILFFTSIFSPTLSMVIIISRFD